ncbi:MAG TPA: hypothetical protein ENJ06_04215 [Phycisphaeraceae bacterium]|nr:hypothetical protein [Phycisphaeraceae bacterium]
MNPEKNHVLVLISAALIIFALLFLTGCVTLDSLAPPVSSELARYAPPTVTYADLEKGRKIYTGSCTSCHSVQPVNAYTMQQWQEILPEMCERAELDKDEENALRAYIASARVYLQQSAVN